MNEKMHLEIRQEQTSDYPDIFDLNKQVFGRENEAKLVDALRGSTAFIPELSIVALLDGKLVGHILFTAIKIRDEKGNLFQSLSLAPMAVETTLQNRGIGSRLVKAGLAKAKQLGYKSVIVLGHADYYPRFGFKPAGNWKINPPFHVPDEVFLALEIVPDGLLGVCGTVEYPREFDSV